MPQTIEGGTELDPTVLRNGVLDPQGFTTIFQSGSESFEFRISNKTTPEFYVEISNFTQASGAQVNISGEVQRVDGTNFWRFVAAPNDFDGFYDFQISGLTNASEYTLKFYDTLPT